MTNASELQPTLAFRGRRTGGTTLNDVLTQTGYQLPHWAVTVDRVTASFSFEIDFPMSDLVSPIFPSVILDFSSYCSTLSSQAGIGMPGTDLKSSLGSTSRSFLEAPAFCETLMLREGFFPFASG